MAVALKEKNGHGRFEVVAPVSNGAEDLIEEGRPYRVAFTITGVSDLLFHAWNCEAVKEKADSGKNSATKKTDAVETYVYRDDAGRICLPGSYVKGAICNRKTGAARSQADPRSPRKSAVDLYNSGCFPLTPLAPIYNENGQATTWDYLHRSRVVVQMAGITRERPAFREGWKADFVFQVNQAQYISPTAFYKMLQDAGQYVGIADFRPTYGRFNISRYDILSE